MLIPVNFLLSLVCLLLLIQRRSAEPIWRVLLLACLLHSLNAGINTLLDGGGWHWLQPVTAVALPVLCRLALLKQLNKAPRPLLAALPVVLMAASVLLLPQAIDLLMPLVWLGCASSMLLMLMRYREPQTPTVATFALRYWFILALVLVAVALLDVSVSILIGLAREAAVPPLLLAGNLLMCAMLSLVLLLAPARTATPVEMPVEVPREPGAEEYRILERVDEQMRQGLYRQTDLNLALLARKTGIPARQVSAAINTLHQQSVSRYVNGWRIREACQRLCAGDESVLDLMEEVGFQTKSNFNREFRRITGKTPSQWRHETSEHPEIPR